MSRTSRSLAFTVPLILVATALGGCAASPADGDGEITLDFAFWGNDLRAEMYDEALALFADEHPEITVRTSFLAWAEYWEKRQTEAAGGGLPDVIQMDMNYLRQYAQNGLLLELDPFLGSVIDADAVPENVRGNGVIDDGLVGLTISTNALGMFLNPRLAEEVGVDGFAGGTWADYDLWLAEVHERAQALGLSVWGGANYATSLQVFETMQRAAGEDLFTEDGEPNFTREDVAAYWGQGIGLLEAGIVTPQRRLEELRPLTAFDAAEQVSSIDWDTMGIGYLANLGEGYPELEIVAPPVTVPGAKDLYQKAGMLLSAASNTDHAESAAVLIDFLSNDPRVGEIFGTNRGIPASTTALEGAEISGIDAQVLAYENSVADRLGAAPPVPPVGYGSLDLLFRTLGEELGHGTVTVDEAVERLFSEMDVLFG